ncbi:MAG TPA: DUF2961 domain-containing protein [Phycisphaerae bacterium]|nr:DUF2961 domain-containing protein [Phycisphaerae bacterium]HRY67639.1 DUF2961 domain-containing protein [Phycisphaerae bacterium]HSA25026.1 DUF2961 domain-containing protein [Phycisphaerae bacterium]
MTSMLTLTARTLGFGCAILISGCALTGQRSSPYGGAPLDTLCTIPPAVETRWASAENPRGSKGAAGQANSGRKGAPFYSLKAGQRQTLAEVTGRSGTVRRIWVTISERDAAMLRGIRVDMYWDGAAQPAVSAPIGDFFCQGLGRMATFENALFASPEGRSFNCYIPMPFRTGMKIEATNESGRDLAMFFYDVNYTLGDVHGPETLYFHAHWRRENPTTLQRDYELLPKVAGRGRYLGVNFGVIANTGTYFRSWWGEGEVKAYIDGDESWPTLCGTGTEDYIGTGWGQGRFALLYQGCPVADREKYNYCFYRLHVPDPIYFHKDIRVTIQQIGCWDPSVKKPMHESGREYYAAGEGRKKIDFSPDKNKADYGLFERHDDWSSCAYFYLDRPTNDLPPLAPVQQRVAGLQ